MSDLSKSGATNDKNVSSLPLRLSIYLNASGGLMVFSVCALMLADIVGRTAFSLPISGVPEIVALLLVLLVFLQLPSAVASRGFIRSELVDSLNGKSGEWIRLILKRASDLAGLAVFTLVTWALWLFLLRAWGRGTTYGTSGIFEIPQWPVLASLTFCSALTVLEFLRNLLRND